MVLRQNGQCTRSPRRLRLWAASRRGSADARLHPAIIGNIEIGEARTSRFYVGVDPDAVRRSGDVEVDTADLWDAAMTPFKVLDKND